MLKEIVEGNFSAYKNYREVYNYNTEFVSLSEPWGVYTISADLQGGISYRAVFAAASEYKSIQPLITSSANTADKVPVTANSHRQKEQFVIHTEFAYSSADERAYIESVLNTLRYLQDKTEFDVLTPTGRLVTVVFTSIDETWPFDYGKAIVIIQAEEYNPFPIFSKTKSVNGKYNGFSGNEAGIKSAPTSTTLTPEVQSE